MAQTRHGQALKVLQYVLKGQPDSIKNLKRQASVLATLHFYSQAEETHRQLLTLDPDQRTTYEQAMTRCRA